MTKGSLLSGLAFGCWMLACASALAQLPSDIMLPTTSPPARKKRPPLPNQLPERPTVAPAVVIAAHPFGFTPPSSIYLGRHDSLVSLDFLDEKHLLFSFREPGLLKRNPTEEDEGLERQMRAVVVSLPDGKVEAQSSWTIPDRAHYVWMLPNGHFLLKDGDGLEVGDASLKVRPLLHFPGRLQSLGFDSEQKIMIASLLEPPELSQRTGAGAQTASVQATATTNAPDPAGAHDLTVRVIDRESLETLHILHGRAILEAPFNAEGYVDAAAQSKKYQWAIRFHTFEGGSRVLEKLQSGCPPAMGFISNRVLFVTSCTPDAMLNLAAISSLDGKTIWQFEAMPEAVWPLLVPSPIAARFARVSMVLKPGVKVNEHPQFAKAVQGQAVRVFDVGNDTPIFEAPVTPALDGGGNVAFSPSARRLALLDGSSIEVFDLPAPAP